MKTWWPATFKRGRRSPSSDGMSLVVVLYRWLKLPVLSIDKSGFFGEIVPPATDSDRGSGAGCTGAAMGLELFKHAFVLTKSCRDPKGRILHTMQMYGLRPGDPGYNLRMRHGCLVCLGIAVLRRREDVYRAARDKATLFL